MIHEKAFNMYVCTQNKNKISKKNKVHEILKYDTGIRINI